MKRRSFIATALASLIAVCRPGKLLASALAVAEPPRLRMILRWNGDTRSCGVVCRMSELRNGDKFIMYNGDQRMPSGDDTFYTAKSDPWIATNEAGLKAGQWTIEAEFQPQTRLG